MPVATVWRYATKAVTSTVEAVTNVSERVTPQWVKTTRQAIEDLDNPRRAAAKICLYGGWAMAPAPYAAAAVSWFWTAAALSATSWGLLGVAALLAAPAIKRRWRASSARRQNFVNDPA